MPNNINQQAVYLQSGSPETENRPADGYSGGQLGSRFTVKDGSDGNKAKGYQLVQLDDSSLALSATAGTVAYWLNPTSSPYQYTITTDITTAGRGNVAGIIRTTVTRAYVCCVQQQGPCDDLLVGSGTPSAAGIFAVPSATAGKADAIAAGSPATYPSIGEWTSVAAGSPSVASADLSITGRS